MPPPVCAVEVFLRILESLTGQWVAQMFYASQSSAFSHLSLCFGIIQLDMACAVFICFDSASFSVTSICILFSMASEPCYYEKAFELELIVVRIVRTSSHFLGREALRSSHGVSLQQCCCETRKAAFIRAANIWMVILYGLEYLYSSCSFKRYDTVHNSSKGSGKISSIRRHDMCTT